MMQLYQHQLDAATMLVQNRRYALWYEMGTGKTATTLSAIRYLFDSGDIRRCLVVCPLAIIDAAWKADAKIFAPTLSVAGFHDKPRQAFWKANIGVINFESFRVRKEDMWKNVPDMLVIDESSRMKDHQSQISKLLRDYARQVRRVVLLSGTPAPNDALEYWSQLYAINPSVLGPSFYSFRFRYGKSEKVYAAGGRGVDKWHADPAKTPDMLRRIAMVSHTLRKEDCLDLPDKVDEVVELDLSGPERKAYDTMKDDLVLRFSDPEAAAVAENVLSEVMKLRQLCNGWCYDENGSAQYTGRTKIVAIQDILEDLGQQCVIWAEYREDAQRLKHLFGEKAAMLIGSISADSRRDAIAGFQQGRYKYLIAHPQAAGHGLTFVNARYAIFYGLGYSYEYHQQARDRIHRIGQKNKCTYIYLLAKDTIEQQILEVVRGKAAAHRVAQAFLRTEAAEHVIS